MKQLRLELHNNVLRCAGRMEKSELYYNSKYPILLPPNHYYVQLLIIHTHNQLFHCGVASVINKIHEHFWIPKLQQQVKILLRKCVICKRYQGKPYKISISPPLPKIRIIEAPPFSVTGIDYTGALLVKENREERKVYVALFTCAVYLALVYDGT